MCEINDDDDDDDDDDDNTSVVDTNFWHPCFGQQQQLLSQGDKAWNAKTQQGRPADHCR